MTLPRILTVGTGAVGAIYSWRLAQACHVTTVCRSNFEAVRQHGFNIDSKKFGQETFMPNQVVRQVPKAPEDQPYDYVLVTLKALPEVYNVADIIAPAVTKGKTTVVLIQNGLGVEEPIVERFPDTPIVSVVAYIGTSQTSLGKIQMVGGETLVVGNYKPSPVDANSKIDSFVKLLEKGGCTVNRVDDVERVRWQKLFWNGTFSPVCAISRMDTTEILNCQPAMDTVKGLMSELVEVAKAAGYDFDSEEQVKTMMERTRATAMDYKPSMLLDVEHGRPMEVGVILGSPLKRAKALGVKVPKLEMVHNLCYSMNVHTLNQKK
ncbi:2-dehydropantoate 2-reductase [Lichtheimia corymbifera JMRC:FSU:9682]|uniref:2-dehydropantoate 2-reductase n=1 Tax=Lichtheimia corymbifera JMRC:FSU:9682 TaxID=1263082 RepID=A0A068RNF1_9FUNG|nr:2-dehydropantoate 2-reductase [Lichtheimia corymbifera JMRC:FSU:9682]